LEAVSRKVGKGKKLSTEDLVVLMPVCFGEIRKDVTETNKRIDAIDDSLSKRIDALYDLMSKNYEAFNKGLMH